MTNTISNPSDRRPIAARRWTMSRVLTRWLLRARVSANAVSVAGMICGIGAGAALIGTAHAAGVSARLLWLVAAGLVQLRLLANMLDGMVAIESGTVSAVGELFNDLPDRVSDSAVLIGLGYAAHGNVALGWLAALLAMLTAYVRAVGKSAGAGSDFCGPMAKPHRMFVVTACAIGCAAAPVEWQIHLPIWTLGLIVAGSAITAARRTIRVSRRLRGRP